MPDANGSLLFWNCAVFCDTSLCATCQYEKREAEEQQQREEEVRAKQREIARKMAPRASTVVTQQRRALGDTLLTTVGADGSVKRQKTGVLRDASGKISLTAEAQREFARRLARK